jgi:hypothetical protein
VVDGTEVRRGEIEIQELERLILAALHESEAKGRDLRVATAALSLVFLARPILE